MNQNTRVCPAENAKFLDMGIRKFFHNPYKILKPFIRPGLTCIDLGCGPGFFTLDMARLAGSNGKVVAVDIQEKMLDMLDKKIKKYGIDNIRLHKCSKDMIGLDEKADLLFVFYMLHEMPDIKKFAREARDLLKPDGMMLVVEPVFHVSKKDFLSSLSELNNEGFKIKKGPHIALSRTALIVK